MSKVVLAYSGGLDTSVLLKRLIVEGHEVIAMTADLGESDAASGALAVSELSAVRTRARALGALDAVVIDARARFADGFCAPALQANAMYEGVYPLSAALSRPLIAELLTETALAYGADAIAHGCTGKGNDQVRIEVAARTLAPSVRCLAPLRERPMSRPDAIAFARANGVEVAHTLDKPYSVDANLWGRSIEAGVLEDPWCAPPEDAFAWTVHPSVAAVNEITLGFEAGLPVALDDCSLDFAALIAQLNGIAGSSGVGRIDHIENRLIGIKSREVYEAPAAVTLLAAHRALEFLVLTRDELRFKSLVDQRYAELVYDGLWHCPLRRALDAFIGATHERVSGEVRLVLANGTASVTGVRSPYSLYDEKLATYAQGDTFDHGAAGGFIHVWGLPLATAALVSRAQEPGTTPVDTETASLDTAETVPA